MNKGELSEKLQQIKEVWSVVIAVDDFTSGSPQKTLEWIKSILGYIPQDCFIFQGDDLEETLIFVLFAPRLIDFLNCSRSIETIPPSDYYPPEVDTVFIIKGLYE